MTRHETKKISLAELARRIGGSLTGKGDTIISGLNRLSDAGADEVAFLANVRYERFMPSTRAAAVIVARDYDGPGRNLIRCDDPYFAFREAMVTIYGFRRHGFDGVDSMAKVDPAADLGEGVAVAQFASVGANAKIGSGTVLYPGVFVGSDVRIGRDCVLYPNVAIYDGCVLGDRVTIHAGSSVGQDGFGYATHAGVHEKIPQAGWVEIGDDVEIGACCAIDRATMGATVVGPGTKMSNLVTVAHGTKIGKGCLFVAQVGVAGSTTMGDYCTLAGQVGVAGHIRLGNNVRVGAKTGVAGDLPDGSEVLGAPAMPLAIARRFFSIRGQLPEMRRTVKRLSAEVAALKERLSQAGKDPR